MNNDTMIKYVKRWQELERKQKDLDYERSVFASDLRKEFGNSGSNGDARFVRWCKDEIRLTEVQANELLLRASLVKTVGSEKTWKELGGFRAMRAVEALPREKRIHVIEAAKTTGKAIRTLVRENEGFIPVRRASSVDDAESMARFILAHVPDSKVTPAMRNIIARYVSIGTGNYVRDAAKAA